MTVEDRRSPKDREPKFAYGWEAELSELSYPHDGVLKFNGRLRRYRAGRLRAPIEAELSSNDEHDAGSTQLISQSGMLQGQRVAVQGYFTSATDTRALWESETAASDANEQRLGPNVDYWAKCITIYPDAASSRFNRRSVIVTGQVVVIEKDDARSLWTCNAVALEHAIIQVD